MTEGDFPDSPIPVPHPPSPHRRLCPADPRAPDLEPRLLTAVRQAETALGLRDTSPREQAQSSQEGQRGAGCQRNEDTREHSGPLNSTGLGAQTPAVWSKIHTLLLTP